LILVLVGEGNSSEKITYIDTRLFPKSTDWVVYGLLIPLSIALVYTFLSPVVNRFFSVYLLRQKRRTIEAMLIEEKETPIPKPEAEQLRKGIREEREKRLAEQEESSHRIAELNRQIDSMIAEKRQAQASQTTLADTGDVFARNKRISAKVSSSLGEFDNDVYTVKGVDLQNEDSAKVNMLVNMKFDRQLAQALYAFSFNRITRNDLQELTGWDQDTATTAKDQLLELTLIHNVDSGTTDPSPLGPTYGITMLGKKALGGLRERGFVPEELKLPSA
jgi:hypothetical protein